MWKGHWFPQSRNAFECHLLLPHSHYRKSWFPDPDLSLYGMENILQTGSVLIHRHVSFEYRSFSAISVRQICNLKKCCGLSSKKRQNILMYYHIWDYHHFGYHPVSVFGIGVFLCPIVHIYLASTSSQHVQITVRVM